MTVALFVLAYLPLVFAVSRRLSWYWTQGLTHSFDISDKRWTAIFFSLIFLPVAAGVLYFESRGRGSFDKPPKRVRKAQEEVRRQTQIESAKRVVKDLQREIDYLASK